MSTSSKPRVFCFDLDGTLCTNTHGDYESAQPFPWAVERVNALAAAGHRIVVFTARGSTTGVDWRELTEGQLRRWGVAFDELRLGKPGADVYVDDRALHTDAWRWSHAISAPTRLGSAEAEGPAGDFAEVPWLPPPRNTTVVEVARTFGGRARLLEQHVEALVERAEAANVPVVLSADELLEAAESAASSEPALLPEGDDLVITLGLSGFAHAAYLDAAEPDTGLTVGCRLLSQAAAGLERVSADGGIAATTRAGERGWPLREGADGALFDPLGGALVTLAGGELRAARGPGRNVALDEFLDVAGVREGDRSIGVDDVLGADEALLVGFPFCLLPLGSMDGRAIGRGDRAAELLDAWSARAGVDLRAQVRLPA